MLDFEQELAKQLSTPLGAEEMPSKSPAQHRLMEAAAHTKGGFGGVPQSVGKDFANADKKKAKLDAVLAQCDKLLVKADSVVKKARKVK